MVRLAHAGTLVIAPATAITAHMLVYDKISQGIEDRQAFMFCRLLTPDAQQLAKTPTACKDKSDLISISTRSQPTPA